MAPMASSHHDPFPPLAYDGPFSSNASAVRPIPAKAGGRGMEPGSMGAGRRITQGTDDDAARVVRVFRGVEPVRQSAGARVSSVVAPVVMAGSFASSGPAPFVAGSEGGVAAVVCPFWPAS